MLAESTARRLLPELAVLVVAGVAAAGILTTFGGKDAADTEAVAWRANEQAGCAAMLPAAEEAGDIARKNAADAASLQGVDPTVSATLVSGATRMSERARELAGAIRRFQAPPEGVDRAKVELAIGEVNLVATNWASLATEYADLETTPAETVRPRIADWTLRTIGAAEQAERSLSSLDLNMCVQVAEALAPSA